MTTIRDFLTCSFRPLLVHLPALAILSGGALRAEIVEFNLDQVPLPTGQIGTINLPYTEEGLRLSSDLSFASIVGPTSPRYTGVKALTPGSYATGEDVNFSLVSTTGRPFAVRSVTLHPWAAGTARNLNFTGWFNGNGYNQVQSTGTALAGITSTFNANFNRVTNLQWRHVRVGGVYQTFQISSIVVEFDGVLTTPTELVVNEAAGTVRVPVSLAHPRTTDTELIREIAAITATQGTDFTLPGGVNFAPVTILAGQTTAYVDVPIVNDATTEGIETFRVTFSSNTPAAAFAGGANFGSCDVKIASDDGVSTFPNWMTAHGLTNAAAAATADPNGDGISNIECWLLRLNPAGPNPPAWLWRRAVMSGGSNDPGLTFVVPTPLPSDVRIIFSQSTDLSSWSEQTRRTGFALGSLWTGSGSARVIESNNQAGRTITLRASVPTGQRPKLFIRNGYEYVPSGGGGS
ncbi:MAG: hypothetical protein HC845_02375 [Akkermansiaceae bacterium]|nr:hypothetical protein [Akkermansiaceae bacterium]